MKLIIGGKYQGKKEYAKNILLLEEKDFLDGRDCSWQEVFECKVIYNFDGYLNKYYRNNVLETLNEQQEGEVIPTEAGESDIYNIADIIIKKNPHIVIISSETGCGVVPVDKVERDVREFTGRMLCKIAQYSEEVHRVFCGIGTVIKGD